MILVDVLNLHGRCLKCVSPLVCVQVVNCPAHLLFRRNSHPLFDIIVLVGYSFRYCSMLSLCCRSSFDPFRFVAYVLGCLPLLVSLFWLPFRPAC